ncbi:hypothetical protein SPOG_02673 [Schizosaccharomyces cryophilus OY26]|uniref:Uncharacterized protein n=1 Tax=Schizosaccharomyces cryophilus (strain OY26 / ATCC MYA-4695 / CBS 11777 / NBRC 106824 / NRRL Y48691) TaxID=653667 RepID=S9XCD2_SCHCR|nr:uncharacterized protein SPOG_02673 [Schizosaccharomyces cryophilus OY26]EPY51501.1 hypothetical protein SPOG_02673 [Schizosaccharomyces cryophilus OY26]
MGMVVETALVILCPILAGITGEQATNERPYNRARPNTRRKQRKKEKVNMRKLNEIEMKLL